MRSLFSCFTTICLVTASFSYSSDCSYELSLDSFSSENEVVIFHDYEQRDFMHYSKFNALHSAIYRKDLPMVALLYVRSGKKRVRNIVDATASSVFTAGAITLAVFVSPIGIPLSILGAGGTTSFSIKSAIHKKLMKDAKYFLLENISENSYEKIKKLRGQRYGVINKIFHILESEGIDFAGYDYEHINLWTRLL